ncbi:MAG: hypothetical protein LC796_15465 [Acidobacteria bacterium]|nr:hypothetical protein [Acidobacteriota bacterium]MCA1611351.1 hypothetical protein [Acidobacteriota bacterium]
MKSPRVLAASLLALAALLLASGSARAEEKSLLAPDGTVYTVRSGIAADLGVTGSGIRPDDNLIEWTSLAQDGKRALGIIPNTTSHNSKLNLDLAFDEQSSSLVLLWKEELSVLNVLHLGVFRQGAWKQLDLLPNLGFAHAYNPRMLLSHQVVHWIDENGKDAWKTRSLLSVIWWEESQYAQARYAPIFLDEDTSANDVPVYDLPSTVGGGGAPTSYDDLPPGAYLYPSLQLEGPGGAILASFADLASKKQYVVRIAFPTDLGTSGPNSKSTLRRRIPVVGITMQGPVATNLPSELSSPIVTIVGPTYNPTLIWSEVGAVRFIRYDAAAAKWSAPRAIALTDEMSENKAMQLVQEMATKN